MSLSVVVVVVGYDHMSGLFLTLVSSAGIFKSKIIKKITRTDRSSPKMGVRDLKFPAKVHSQKCMTNISTQSPLASNVILEN